MEERVKEVDYRGYRIAVEYDTDPQSPDDWGNDDMFLVYDHRQFFVKREGFNPDDIFEALEENKKTFDGYWFFPVYAYIHSGVSLSLGRNSYPFTDRWDVSFKGFALVKRMKGWSWMEDQAYDIAESLIKEWNKYLSNEVYGFNIYDLDEDGDEGDSIDSCWGYFGSDGIDQLIEECKGTIDHIIAEKTKKEIERKSKDLQDHIYYLKTMIRNRVPLHIRFKCPV